VVTSEWYLGKLVANKHIRTDGSSFATRDSAVAEANLLLDLQHPHIIRLFSYTVTRDAVDLHMEHGGTALFDCLHTLPHPQPVFVELCSAVAYLHEHGIAHRDLKLENVVIDKAGHARLIDFGLAKVCTVTHYSVTKIGSVSYGAPEMWVDQYDVYKADVWSLGIILLAMVHRTLPFERAWEKDDAFCKFKELQANGNAPYASMLLIYSVTANEWVRLYIDATLVVDPAARCNAVDLL
jgi:serine/threonine protein kinase